MTQAQKPPKMGAYYQGVRAEVVGITWSGAAIRPYDGQWAPDVWPQEDPTAMFPVWDVQKFGIPVGIIVAEGELEVREVTDD